jgi:hypothetical protein
MSAHRNKRGCFKSQKWNADNADDTDFHRLFFVIMTYDTASFSMLFAASGCSRYLRLLAIEPPAGRAVDPRGCRVSSGSWMYRDIAGRIEM